MKKYVLAVFALVLTMVSCASIIHGGNQKVMIQAEPSDAQIKVFDGNGMEIWSSLAPTEVILKRSTGFFQGANYTVEISKDGYQTVTIPLTPNIAGWYIAGNFFFGGMLGWIIVDPLTGAMWTLSPDEVYASLDSSLSYEEGDEGLYIVLKEQISPEVFAQLELERVN